MTGLSEAEQGHGANFAPSFLTFAGVLAPFKAMTPPRIAAGVGNEYMKLGKLGFAFAAWAGTTSANSCGCF